MAIIECLPGAFFMRSVTKSVQSAFHAVPKRRGGKTGINRCRFVGFSFAKTP